MKWAVALVLFVAACDDGRPAPLRDCEGDLRGVWQDGDGRRFDVIGGSRNWEWYPMYEERPALPGDAGVVAAPAMLDFRGEVTGNFTRRYERGSAVCAVKTAAYLHDCHGDRLALDVRPPAPPLDFTTCIAPEPAVETWLLVRER